MLPQKINPIFKQIKPGVTKLIWPRPLRNVFIAKKRDDDKVLSASRIFLKHVHENYNVNIMSSPYTHKELGLPFITPIENHSNIDLVVALGGDGTILRANKLFQIRPPPILSISLGTLGFLLPFSFDQAQQAFKDVYESNAYVTRRSRLLVQTPKRFLRAINEVTIHRNGSPHLSQLNISVDGQYLTTTIADGVAISTPTGSTAYALSAGGPIVHPGLEGILVVPICPRSLSFRPLLVPSATALTISVDKGSRGELGVSIDGGEIELLQKEQSVSIHADLSLSESVYCVSRGSETADWVSHVNGLLGFNSMFGQLHNRST
ncbi:NADH kinase [Starmerella bacillaris]|uniref:NADH kinase n=1 Tax=Starmerella bacillaris TaxID=1247836 RepID=A0AAV5RER3_STABA|nr:NADH kinase [Starmerella bacillaris]